MFRLGNSIDREHPTATPMADPFRGREARSGNEDVCRSTPEGDRRRDGRWCAKFAIVGGLAVSARAEPPMTRDADLAIAVETDAEAEGIVLSMRLRG